jgi:ankyrin repeat protein
VVKLLLDKDGVGPDSKDRNGGTPLWRAAENGHDAVVKLLLNKEGVDPNSKDNFDGRTPLWRAAANGHEAVVKLLVEKGAELQPTTAASI